MPIIEGRDYVMAKNAYYFDSGLIQQSGVLVVTRARIMLNVIQTVDPDPGSDVPASVKELKKDVRELKKSVRAIGEYGKRKKEIEFFAESCSDIADFEKKVASQGVFNAKSLALSREEVVSCRFGWFFGLKLELRDGKKYSISTMRLGKIKKFIRGT